MLHFIPLRDFCVFTRCCVYKSKALKHLIVTRYLPCTHSYFCHTLAFCVSVLSADCDAVPRHAGTYTGGHVWPRVVPGEHGSTTLVLSVTYPVSQSFPGKNCEREWREVALLNGSKMTIPPINCRPQTCLNGAGFLKTPARWNWVKEDLMSHFLHWKRFLPIIISYTMT